MASTPPCGTAPVLPEAERPASLAANFEQAVRLLEEARSLGRVLEGPGVPAPVLVSLLADGLGSLLARTSGLLRRLQRDCEAVASDLAAAQGLADLAFAARMDLGRAAGTLAACSGDEALALECDRALRHLARALRATLHELSPFVSLPAPPGEASDELSVARAVRASYGRLRATIRQVGSLNAVPGPALAAAREALESLFRSTIASRLRLRDRIVLDSLRQRLAAWDAAGLPAEDGERLWSEVSTSVELLRAINRREVLLRADATAIRRARSLLAAGDAGAAFEEARGALEGRDDLLDDVLLAGPDAAARLRVVLDALDPDTGGKRP